MTDPHMKIIPYLEKALQHLDAGVIAQAALEIRLALAMAKKENMR